jgi:hypothetical protein
VCDDPNTTGDLQVAHHHVRVLRRTWSHVKSTDNVDSSRGDRRLWVLSSWTDHDDRRSTVGHDAFDGLQAARPQIEVEEHSGGTR